MKNEGPKWYQLFGIIVWDMFVVCVATFLILNNHPFWGFFLLLFVSDGRDFGVNITWNNDKEDDQ